MSKRKTTLDRKTEAFEKKEEELNRRMTALAQTQSEAEELKAKPAGNSGADLRADHRTRQRSICSRALKTTSVTKPL